MKKIYLDAGHGGADAGAVGANGLYEKNLVLKIQQYLISYLNSTYSDFTIKTTRTTDTFLSLSQRASQANSWGADAFMSIHVNAGGGTGYEDYVYRSASNASKTFQSIVHGQVQPTLLSYNHPNRGRKSANYAVLRLTNMPAVLTEIAFIDNRTDAALLQNEAFLKSMGESYAKGIAVYLNLPRRAVPNPNPTPTPNPSPSEPGTKTYTIKQGDTLYSIAQKYNITVQALQEANTGLSDPLTLQVGKTIVIPSGTSPNPSPTPPAEQYPLPNGILKQGDSGEAVKQLQRALNAVNFKVGSVDGIYGVQTKDAVRRFQLVYLPYDVDGIYGPQTKNKLAAVLKAKS
ncbi:MULTISPECIES: N-acetylmuramoyl-L-alanine amidase [Priestia]|jgi:N-acetylmuramoyl-L-alanine amidase|uniref:N-acetylmuramoyl-L-alanine amidase n=3 Tax=Priestia TaxID=2800373 RepID=A0A2B2DTJ9_PRIMG|nr:MULTISPECIES: N-acetylmuramoyl-L-alanine amidase [Priestia]AVX09993.1 N-acetylmuramoyl-L-alanine amidase [Bacillus sp. Y-01]KOP76090.1 N-acetylmuramoyl-L-alanine amidase [Bacillus sp. FJAT-21351]MBZ5478404.1 N-acetylmuramoyl-L-alanine amidase [Bacillus sp. T_4]MDH6652889.1 N-acetylmuramoyl-L-alanine amidase [Bacillus sp. PvP124]MDP9577010.1 N-acetylmuramoyl-L-alanine amidase [Bacillus sp. 1751]RFB25789.1 LysM peptidoglycan-binding domain-containing protein [Bacillus sp. ALD]RFB36934.1 Lys